MLYAGHKTVLFFVQDTTPMDGTFFSLRLYKPLSFIIFKDFSTTSGQRESFVQLPSV